MTSEKTSPRVLRLAPQEERELHTLTVERNMLVIRRPDGSWLFTLAVHDCAFAEQILASLLAQAEV